MNKKDLIALGISEEIADQVVILHGKDIEKHKTSLTEAQTNLETIQSQLTAANKQIEDFKGLNIDQIKAAADEYKTKYEQSVQDAANQVTALKLDHAIETALTGAKAKNAKAVRALLSNDTLKLAEDGSVTGLTEQLEKIKSENDYLFEDGKPAPKIVTTANNKSVTADPLTIAMRTAAKLPIE